MAKLKNVQVSGELIVSSISIGTSETDKTILSREKLENIATLENLTMFLRDESTSDTAKDLQELEVNGEIWKVGPTRVGLTLRDTVSNDTTNILKEIEINNEKWKIPEKTLYQHNIYIAGGQSTAAGTNVYFSFINNSSTPYTSGTTIASALYSANRRYQSSAVQASGRYGSSSSSFNGFVIGVYASVATYLYLAYCSTTGAVSTVSILGSYVTSGYITDTVIAL